MKNCIGDICNILSQRFRIANSSLQYSDSESNLQIADSEFAIFRVKVWVYCYSCKLFENTRRTVPTTGNILGDIWKITKLQVNTTHITINGLMRKIVKKRRLLGKCYRMSIIITKFLSEHSLAFRRSNDQLFAKSSTHFWDLLSNFKCMM